MHANHGFTLVEVLFTISTIIILSVFTLHFSLVSKPKVSLEQQCIQVIAFLEDAKSKALLNHQQIDIIVDSKWLQYQFNDYERIIKLSEDFYFENNYNFHFNRNGNINTGGHFNLCNQSRCKSIILNVGSGAFYVR